MNRAYRTREFCGAKLGKENEVFRPDGKLLYVERSLKNGTDELTEYIWAGSTLWAEKRTTGTESAVYYHADYHGTTEVITDEAAVVVWKAGYDAYGNMLEATGVTEFEASYTGKMYDRDTGLYYFNARWYDAELGRFTTPDPARDGANWVVYCAANPVGRWDPTGLNTLDDFAYQQRTAAGRAEREAEEASTSGNIVEAEQKRQQAQSLRESANDAENRYKQNNRDCQTRVIVMAQINLNDSINNFLYNLLVHWQCGKIEKAANKAGYSFSLLEGSDGNAYEFSKLQQDPSIARIIVIGHGYEQSGYLADETDVFKPYSHDYNFYINWTKCVVPVIDMVGCYANTNNNYRNIDANTRLNRNLQVNTYNRDGEQIWFWQTNEVLGKTIPDSIENGNSNSGKEPANFFVGFFYSIFY